MLTPTYSPAFDRDVKRLRKRRRDLAQLKAVIDLILQNTPESLAELRRHHNMHALSGSWAKSSECHVCNAGDWLLIWRVSGDLAIMQRTGTHDELFR